jgi:hypothetical protein
MAAKRILYRQCINYCIYKDKRLLPYAMALDSTVNVAVGLQYTLALSAPGGTGTGLAQPYSVNGTMPAGQAGTCAGANCGVTQVRTLTITY